MLKFKEFLFEEREYLNRPELESKVGNGGMSSILKHPFFKKHVIDTAQIEPKFTHIKWNDSVDKVEAISQPHKYVMFDMVGTGKRKRVGNAHLFRWDGKTRMPNGGKMWVHHSSHIEDEE